MRRALAALAGLLAVARCTANVTDGSGTAEDAGGDPVVGAALSADNCASWHSADPLAHGRQEQRAVGIGE